MLGIRRAVALALLFALGGTSLAGDADAARRQLEDLFEMLDRSPEAAARVELMRELGGLPQIRAAERLRKAVRTDPAVEVRVAAAHALGASPVPEALDYLFELAPEGGPRNVRRELGRSIARRDGRARLLSALAAESDALGRGLLVEALATDPSEAASRELERLARGEDAHLRTEALRHLAAHPAAGKRMPALLCEVLLRRKDTDTVLAGLDVAQSLADDGFRAVAELLETFLEPEVQDAVEAAKRRLAWLDAVAAAKRANKDGYTAAGELPEPPAPRPRIDVVYVFDATGSVCGHVPVIQERIRREARSLVRVGADLRIGVVAYRDTPRRRASWATQALPLTYDLAAVEKWIAGVAIGGCDSQGACVTEALDQAFGRMGWRWTAQRQTALIADSKTGDPDASSALVRLHREADASKLHVWYLFRTRPKPPPDIELLAKLGGGVLESLE